MTFGRTADPRPGLLTLGRLVVSGVISGGVIGATVGALVLFAPDDRSAFWVGGLLIGACLGMVAGLCVQGVTCAAVLVTTRHGSGSAAVRGVALLPPAFAVVALAWTVSVGSALPARAGITALALLEAAVLLGATLAWSLAQLASGARTASLTRAPVGHGTPQHPHHQHPRRRAGAQRPGCRSRRRTRTADRPLGDARACLRHRPAARRRAVRRHDHLRRR